MAKLKVFVSSTCYDLNFLRSQLRNFITSMGYEPIMSDYNDVLFDPRKHTHTSCVEEVTNCDMLILVIGSRYGGEAVGEALSKVNFEQFSSERMDIETIKKNGTVSITQLEVLHAYNNKIPVYTFVDKRVWHEHEVYQKNKKSDIIDQITFPAIEKQETAQFIFGFIDFARLRSFGNSINLFENVQDIETTLKKQWSNYFQRLLHEQQINEKHIEQIDVLSDKFDDLKEAMLSTIDNSEKKTIARGVISFRKLFNFLSVFKLDNSYLANSKDSWEELLQKNKIEIYYSKDLPSMIGGRKTAFYVVPNEKYFFICRNKSRISMSDLAKEWNTFTGYSATDRKIISEELLSNNENAILRKVNESFWTYVDSHSAFMETEDDDNEIDWDSFWEFINNDSK